MDASQHNWPDPANSVQPGTNDPRLKPTPDYAQNLGPEPVQDPVQRTLAGHGARRSAVALGALALGLCLLSAAMMLQARAGWSRTASVFPLAARPSFTSHTVIGPQDLAQLDRMKPQAQAEALLEAAVGRVPGAAQQIATRADRWYGHLVLQPQLNTLVTASLNSEDLQVREAALDVQLAAYNLSKTPASVDLLVREADSANHARRVWALWSLGAMANRRVETDQAVTALLAHLKDSDEDSRRWAVEGLSLAGTAAVIEPLLSVLHDDVSPAVRERAACGLASSGMFTAELRSVAVPQLILYTADPALDARTHAWAFQALGDITRQRLPNDSAAWRNWYENSRD